MALLSASDLTHCSTVPLAEQLLYLAHGEQALGDLDQIQQPNPPPQEVTIPRDLWDTIHKIPLSLEYYTSVLHSLKTHPQFWEGVVEGKSHVEDFSAFPWRADSIGVGLDNFVVLRCLDEQACLAKVAALMEDLMDSLSVPLLRDVIETSPSEPVLIFYEESCPRSQVLLSHIEQEIRVTLKV